jgi:hypothetical protein
VRVGSLFGFVLVKLSVTNIITPMAALPSSQVKTKPKPSKNATATRVKKETTAVVCVRLEDFNAPTLLKISN